MGVRIPVRVVGIAAGADAFKQYLTADEGAHYDQIIDINLSEVLYFFN